MLTTRVDETGQYRVYCAEYCGGGHSRRTSTLVVADQQTYRDWLADRGNASTGGNASTSGSPTTTGAATTTGS